MTSSLLLLLLLLVAITNGVVVVVSDSSEQQQKQQQQQQLQGPYAVSFYHHISTYVGIDLVRVIDYKTAGSDGDESWMHFEVVQENIPPHEIIEVTTNGPGEVFRAILSSSSSSSSMENKRDDQDQDYQEEREEEIDNNMVTTISEIIIEREQTEYEITPHNTKGTTYLEPYVELAKVVLPPQVCDQLIALSEATGIFDDDYQYESIDVNEPLEVRQPASGIDIMNFDNVYQEQIWNTLKPFLPPISQLVQNQYTTNEVYKLFEEEKEDEYDNESDKTILIPRLDWVFIRKYTPNTRKSLRPHADSNLNSVTIELVDDYEGGGLYYVQPPVYLQKLFEGQKNDAIDRPFILESYERYEFNDNVQRSQEQPDLVFPDLKQGDAIIYNYTVYHGIAPILSGTRYSLVLFYDMDNPAVEHEKDYYDNDDGIDYAATIMIDVVFQNMIVIPKPDEVVTHATEIVDIVYIVDEDDDSDDAVDHFVMLHSNLQPTEKVQVRVPFTVGGVTILALKSGTTDVLSEFVIDEEDQFRYDITYNLEEEEEDQIDDYPKQDEL